MSRRALITAALLLAGGAGCRAGGCVAATLGDVVGATDDSYCDRRHVPGDREPASFCQELVDSLAGSQFREDCAEKHAARTGEGRCPREELLGGCKLHKENDDGSEVIDWFYDVSAFERDGGLAFVDPALTTEDVKELCADPTRYEEGASFVEP